MTIKTLFLFNSYFFNLASLTNLVEHVQSFYNSTEASVLAVEVLGVFAGKADEKLRTASVTSCVCHRENSAVVVLIATVEVAFDFLARSTCSDSWVAKVARERASALNYEFRDYAMEAQSVVKAFFGQFNEICHRIWCVVEIEVHLHGADFGFDFCDFHDISFFVESRHCAILL